MTLKFDRKVIHEMKVQKKLFDDTKYENDASVAEMVVKKVPASFLRPFIASGHYSHVMPDNAMECYAGFYKDKFAGGVVYGNGANNGTFTALIPEIEVKNSRELMRLWSPDGMPKNTESKLIAESIKMLPDDVYLVVSFADPGHNHVGSIYQATNFLYCGMSSPSQMMINDKGETSHVRTIGSYKRRHEEYRSMTNKEVMAILGYKYIPSAGKHRYVYLRGQKWIKNLMLKELQSRIMEYPKMQ